MWPFGPCERRHQASGIRSLKPELKQVSGTSAAFTSAGADGVVSDDIMRLKRGKLLGNLINGIHVVMGDGPETEELHELAMDEARACFAAAGLHWEEDTRALGARMSPPRPVHGAEHQGSSTWQSLQRGRTLETDYLNGEIVLLGRLHGVPTPVNADIQRRAMSSSAAGANGAARP